MALNNSFADRGVANTARDIDRHKERQQLRFTAIVLATAAIHDVHKIKERWGNQGA